MILLSGVLDFRVITLDSYGTPIMQAAFPAAITAQWSLQPTSDGGFIGAGITYMVSGSNYSDIWILKLDASGQIVWQKSYGGSRDDEAMMVKETSDAGYIVVGVTEYDGDDDMLILRLDSSGDVVWRRKLGGANFDKAFAVQQTPDAGFIVAGSTKSYGEGYESAWLVKLTPNGSITWQKTYGSNFYNRANYIINISSGGYLAAGYTRPSGHEARGWLFKINADGTVEWEKTYIEPPYSYLREVKQTADGGFIAVGSITKDDNDIQDIWLLKVDASGNQQWSKKYNGGYKDQGYSVDQLADGGYIVGGSTERPGGLGPIEPFVLRVDGDGGIPNCPNITSAPVTVYSTTATEANTTVSSEDFLLTIVETGALRESISITQTLICDSFPPSLEINYTSGAPGSYFTLSGSNFPVATTVDIDVNGYSLGSVVSDAEGTIMFLLTTSNANEGYYFVRANVLNSSATTIFVLDAAEPVRPQEEDGPIFDVPNGIALEKAAYMPMIMGS